MSLSLDVAPPLWGSRLTDYLNLPYLTHLSSAIATTTPPTHHSFAFIGWVGYGLSLKLSLSTVSQRRIRQRTAVSQCEQHPSVVRFFYMYSGAVIVQSMVQYRFIHRLLHCRRLRVHGQIRCRCKPLQDGGSCCTLHIDHLLPHCCPHSLLHHIAAAAPGPARMFQHLRSLR